MSGHDEQMPPPRPEPEDAALASMLRDRLRARERSLDAETLARLRGARKAAVAVAAKRGLRWPWSLALPALGTAAFAGWVLLGPLQPRPSPSVPGPTESAQIEVLELLGSDDSPVTDDDVEFVNWLDDAHGDS